MKKFLLVGISVLLLSGAAHATDACYVVQETPDNFLAMRYEPTTRSKINWALRNGDIVVDMGRAISNDPKFRWRYVRTRDEVNGFVWGGWVYKKYIKEVPCVCPEEAIDGACEPESEEPEVTHEPAKTYPKWLGIKGEPPSAPPGGGFTPVPQGTFKEAPKK